MKNISLLSLPVMVLLFSACSSNSASHLPSPFELPGAVIGSVFENATYGARRRRVESYVAKNYLAIRNDVRQGGGQTLEDAFNVAGIKGAKRNKAKSNFLNNKAHYFHHVVSVSDNLMHNFAALYVSKSKADKKINGFTYSEARNVIRNYADKNFESLRIAIQQGQGGGLEELASRLNINDAQKRVTFKQRAKPLYKTIYLELVTVGLMINS
ncbi:MAG TPA: hypothetical protein EYG68_05380 [Leucothrix mucor]|nr:hypothetical protein [Leucothrix mucor]